jgi:hypothetical protein
MLEEELVFVVVMHMWYLLTFYDTGFQLFGRPGDEHPTKYNFYS